MATYELLPWHLGSAREVVDLTGDTLDGALRLPEGVRSRRVEAADAAQVDPGPDIAVVAEADYVALPAVLNRFRPGTRAVLFYRWPADGTAEEAVGADGPASGLTALLDRLAAASCQVLDVAPLDGDTAPVLVAAECVDKLAQGDDDLPALLRAVNRGAAADVTAARLAALADRITATEYQLRRTRAQRRGVEAKLAALEASTGLLVGRAIVQGVRSPLRGVVSVPRDLARIIRQRHRGETPDRIVELRLPARARRDQRWLTLRAPRDMIVATRLDGDGLAGYEPDSMACLLAAADVAGPGAIYDVGANIGVFAALASAMTDRDVYAFEPTPSLAAAARRFARDNRLAWRTEAIALGAENGSATFYLSDTSDSSNSLAEGFRPSSAHIDVPVETLDSYAARTGAVPAVVKIDTESTEPDVLAGAAATIAAHRPWILCEVLANRVEDRLMEVLAPHGYRYFQITERIPYARTDTIVGDTRYQHLNWLFAPEEPDERFWAAARKRSKELAASGR